MILFDFPPDPTEAVVERIERLIRPKRKLIPLEVRQTFRNSHLSKIKDGDTASDIVLREYCWLRDNEIQIEVKGKKKKKKAFRRRQISRISRLIQESFPKWREWLKFNKAEDALLAELYEQFG